jgi:hypothetical protein
LQVLTDLCGVIGLNKAKCFNQKARLRNEGVGSNFHTSSLVI